MIGRYQAIVFAFFLGLFLLDRFWHVSLFSFVPLFLIIPVLLTWQSAQPLLWGIVWAGVALFFTTAAPPIVIGVALLPWLIRQLLPRIYVDLSFSFLCVLLLTVALQLGFIFRTVLVPWEVVIPMWFLSAGISFIALIVARQLSPDV